MDRMNQRKGIWPMGANTLRVSRNGPASRPSQRVGGVFGFLTIVLCLGCATAAPVQVETAPVSKAPVVAPEQQDAALAAPVRGGPTVEEKAPNVLLNQATPTRQTPEAKSAEFVVPVLTDELKNNTGESELVEKIIEWRSLLPADLRKPSSMSIEQLHGLVDNTLALSDVYLKRFPEGEGRKKVLPAVCKLWVINNTRYFVAVSKTYESQNGESMPLPLMMQVRGQYWDMVLTLIDEAIELNPEGKIHEEMLTLKGQASWFGQRYDNAVAAYSEVLEKYPESPKDSENLLALLNAYLTGRKFDKSIVIADQFLKEYPRDVLVPHVYQLKAKALLEGGRAQEALAWWMQSAGFLADAASGRPVKIGEQNFVFPSEARQSFRRYADEAGFMIGFLNGYLGNYETAREAFAAAMENLNELQAQNALDPRSQVFAGRNEKVYTAYLTLVEKPAPSYEIRTWLDELPIDPIEEKGKVVVLIFAPYENPRYDEFLQIAQKLYTDHWHEGLRVGWIADPKGFSDFPSQIGRLSSQRNRLGLTYPIGMETERGWPNFKKYQASVGGGTLVVLDRSGTVAWYKMDPTYRDENLVKRMVRRLLDQKP